ncbi:hypothetical protein [Haliscomenobacter sp.]|uniref:hypothetical protein n=1 Tax=Haliscomenobacter sp. TaxID=2717303 RepID=UPI003BA9A21F
MSADEIRDFFNRHFVGENDQPLPVHLALTVQVVDTGETITLPSLKTPGTATLYEMFHAVHEYLKQNGPIAHNSQPGAAPAPRNKVLNMTPMVHNKKTYFVELREGGLVIIQDQQRNVLEAGKTYDAILKKYEALKDQQQKEK